MRKIALGTVQFGLPYGVANVKGQVSAGEIPAILSLAREGGIDTLDTAVAYGDAEARLGRAGVHNWRVVSKLPPLPEGCSDVEAWMEESVAGSLQRLGIERLHGLLLHRSRDLLGDCGGKVFDGMRRAKQNARVRKIGVSIYAPEELEAVAGRYDIDLVQAPYNVFDRRIQETGWLERLHQNAVEIHVRSVFLQGLLLMRKADRPGRFSRWERLFTRWEDWLRETQTSPLSACLHFALSRPEIDRVVVGVDARSHLKDILSVARKPSPPPPAWLASADTRLINPSEWNLQ